MDFSGKLTLLLLLAASVIRFLADFEDIGSETFLILITVCTTLIWLSLYYFVFEMLLIKYLIQETNVNQFNKKKHLVGLCKWITFVISITYVILISLHQITIADSFHSEVEIDIQLIISWIMIGVKFIGDLFMLQLFIQLFIFFIRQKQNIEKKLSPYNKFIIGTIIFLLLMTFYQSAISVAYTIMLQLNFDKDKYALLYEISAYLIIPVIDFMIALCFTILYLHQFNERKNQKKKSNGRGGRNGAKDPKSFVHSINS